MESSSSLSKSAFLAVKESSSNYYPYPPPLAKYEDVIASPKLFISSLEKLHASLGTKFMIPIIGGKELDLHRLFVEVTARGGIEKIIRERRWKEVTAVFNFPSTATNASFVLRKYYVSLLHHFEQIYFFKAQGYSRGFPDSLQSPQGMPFLHRSADNQEAMIHPSKSNPSPSPLPSDGRNVGSWSENSVVGVIDGKFESGYLVTVTIGSETLKGVLYQTSLNQSETVSLGMFSGGKDITPALPVVQRRRRRRKKSEIRRRDPAHPKPNRSGYNFFFAEQHARLKPLYPGRDREISRMIGELWNKLNESERTVYQDKAMKDKERYRAEMEEYRERLRTGQVIRDAVPLQQRLPQPVNMEVEADVKIEEAENVDSPETPYNESSSSKCESEDHQMAEDSDENTSRRNINVEIAVEDPGFEEGKTEEREVEESCSPMKTKDD